MMASSLEMGRLLISTPSVLHRKPVPLVCIRSPVQCPHEGRVSTFASASDSSLLAASTSSSSQHVTKGHKERIKKGLAGAAASVLLAAACAPAGAYNVRLQDVENKAMQAGEEAVFWSLLAGQRHNVPLLLVTSRASRHNAGFNTRPEDTR